MKVIIKPSLKDIQNGEQKKNFCCPIARCVSRWSGTKNKVGVGSFMLTFVERENDYCSKSFSLWNADKSLAAFIWWFDTLKAPEELQNLLTCFTKEVVFEIDNQSDTLIKFIDWLSMLPTYEAQKFLEDYTKDPNTTLVIQ